MMQRFTDAVGSCAHNPGSVRMLEQSRVFSRPQRRARMLRRVAEDENFGMQRYASHRALVRALRAGDSQAAERIALGDAQGGLDALRQGEEPAADPTPPVVPAGPVATR